MFGLQSRIDELLHRPEIEFEPRKATAEPVEGQSPPDSVDMAFELPADQVLTAAEQEIAHLTKLFYSLPQTYSSSNHSGGVQDREYIEKFALVDGAAQSMVALWEDAALSSCDVPRILASDVACTVTYLADYLASCSKEIRELKTQALHEDSIGYSAYSGYVQYLWAQVTTAKRIREKVEATVELMRLGFQESVLDSILAGISRQDLVAVRNALNLIRSVLYLYAVARIGVWKTITRRFRVYLRRRMREDVLFRVWREMDDYLDRFRSVFRLSGDVFRRLAHSEALEVLLGEAVDVVYKLKRKRDVLTATLWQRSQEGVDLLEERTDVSKELVRIASVLRVIEGLIAVLDETSSGGRLPGRMKARVLNRLGYVPASTKGSALQRSEAASDRVVSEAVSNAPKDTEARTSGQNAAWVPPNGWGRYDLVLRLIPYAR